MTGSPYLAVNVRSLAAILSVLNLALPDAGLFVEEGELLQGTLDLATDAFDALSDKLTDAFGDDTWLDEPTEEQPWTTAIANIAARGPAPTAAAPTPAQPTPTDTRIASPASARSPAPPLRTPQQGA